jgi:hypothetical protein
LGGRRESDPARHCRRDLVYRTSRLPVALAAKDFPPFTTVQAYSTIGGTRACTSGSILNWCCRRARPLAANPVPLLASSTANRSRSPKAADHEGYGQESQRPIGPCRDRHFQPAGGCCGPSCRQLGSRWGRDRHPSHARPISLVAPSVCRQRLYGPNLREALAKAGDWKMEVVTRAAGVTGFPLGTAAIATCARGSQGKSSQKGLPP